MKKFCLACAGGLLLAAAGAFADDGNVVRTHVLEVKQRLAHLERIDVTAEKPTSPDAEALDEELLAILENVARLEADQSITADR